MDGIIVIGTDTGVGKTAICAGLLKLLHATRKVSYWKAIQTAAIIADDVKEVSQLTGLSGESILDPLFRFPEPLTPMIASQKWGKTISVDALIAFVEEQRKAKNFLVIEGAGGVLVPYNEKEQQIDFMKRVKMPVLLVGEDRVGTVNQALLTLKVMKDANLDILGMVLTKMRGTFGNAEVISSIGGVEILCQLPDFPDKGQAVSEISTNPRLRQLLNVPLLP